MESGRIHVIVDVHSIFLCPQWSRCGLQGSKRALSNSGWIILLKIVFGPRRSVLMLKGFSLWMMQLNLIRDLLYSSINGDKRTWDRSAQEIWSRCGLERSKRALSNSGWIILLKIVFGPRKLQPPGGLWRWKYFGFLGTEECFDVERLLTVDDVTELDQRPSLFLNQWWQEDLWQKCTRKQWSYEGIQYEEQMKL